ncbi:unnamed protein product [Camellia sinensis]
MYDRTTLIYDRTTKIDDETTSNSEHKEAICVVCVACYWCLITYEDVIIYIYIYMQLRSISRSRVNTIVWYCDVLHSICIVPFLTFVDLQYWLCIACVCHLRCC